MVLLPEMDGRHDVPEITTRCWAILRKHPGDMMCATSRMVVKRQGAERPSVVPCTLIPYDEAFDMGPTLAQAAGADGGMFAAGTLGAAPGIIPWPLPIPECVPSSTAARWAAATSRTIPRGTAISVVAR